MGIRPSGGSQRLSRRDPSRWWHCRGCKDAGTPAAGRPRVARAGASAILVDCNLEQGRPPEVDGGGSFIGKRKGGHLFVGGKLGTQ